MQQRQLRLGDILDDYCPQERRVTNHAVVAMIGPEVKRTRCTTCDAEHEYKHAKVPRQRRKADTPAALYSQVASGAPKRVVHDPGLDEERPEPTNVEMTNETGRPLEPAVPAETLLADAGQRGDAGNSDSEASNDRVVKHDDERERGPVHRPLIRASLPRPDGQPPPSRPLPEFTIRQPGTRSNRFRSRHQRGPHPFSGNLPKGKLGRGPSGGGMSRQAGGRSPERMMPDRLARRHAPGRKRSK